MRARVIEQEGQVLVVELESGIKRVIKIDRVVDLKDKEVLLVREGGIFPTLQVWDRQIDYRNISFSNFAV
jgi:hypothetical protein